MKIMMTGASGHSGKWFVERLMKEGFKGDLNCLVRNDSHIPLAGECPFNINIFHGRIEEWEVLEESMIGADIVLHIAGIHYSVRILEAAIKAGVKWVILVHTTGRYSRYKSASSEYIRIEDGILRKRDERILNGGQGPDITIVRPTMIYGSQMDANMHKLIGYLSKHRLFPIFGDGNNLMRPVHARDLGYAFYDIIMHSEITKNREYNISGKYAITYKEIIKITCNELGRKVRIVHIPFWLSLKSAKLYNYIFGRKAMISVEQVLRMQEDKAFSHKEATKDFGYDPIGFEEGIGEEIRILKNQGFI